MMIVYVGMIVYASMIVSVSMIVYVGMIVLIDMHNEYNIDTVNHSLWGHFTTI